MSATEFDLRGPLPTGTTVLEASAGTGKTFTIAALTTRYVADGVPLSQIMLVTFGNAASRELRDRVRERLVSAELGLRHVDRARRQTADEVLVLLATGTDDEVRRRRERLVQALSSFDSATIATTHSFCNQMLTGLGVAADRDPSAVLTETIDDLRHEVIDDLYLRVFADPLDTRPPFLSPEALGQLGAAATGGDRQARLEPAGAAGEPGRRHGAARAVRVELAARKRARGIVDYDDWLVQLRDALSDPVTGVVARERVRRRYRVVMVDEFQDTDPVQWEVLRSAFHGHTTLVLIGDPKQAIYSFRGGDVVTYLAATAVADTHATLGRSWRSDVGVVRALQRVLGGVPLGSDRIVVHPVEAVHARARLTGAGPPLRLRHLPMASFGLPEATLPSVKVVRPAVAADVAADVVELLTGGARLHSRPGQADDEERPVGPGDIAVLVRTNDNAQLVRDALAAVGVPAVTTGSGSVFATEAAAAWLVLLEALEQPHRAGRVRAAALTIFLGVDETTLDGRGDDLTDELGHRLRTWAELLAGRGVAAFLEVLTEQEQLPERVLGRPRGERLLTDLRHTGQVLHTAVQEQSLGLTALVEWLRRRIDRAGVERADDRSRRLDSDGDAVQVMTVHTSKGLEFPVVHVPFAWDRYLPRAPDVLRLHDEQGHRVLHVGGPGSPGYDAAREVGRAEELGEDLRLLYVAVTRASCQVVAHWAPTSNTRNGALHRVLFGTRDRATLPAAVPVPEHDESAAAVLQEWADGSGGLVGVTRVEPVPITQWTPGAPATPSLAARRFTRRLDQEWSRTSYSALTRTAHEQSPVSEPEEPGTEDERDSTDPAATETTATEPTALPSPLSDLPGGAAFGTLVHAVLEDLDPAALGQRCAEAVGRFAVPGVVAAALADALRPVLDTPLDAEGTTLGAVSAANHLAELDFELPLAGGDEPVPGATVADIAALLGRHDLGPVAGYAELLAALPSAVLRGYLTGSIDAVLRLPGPRYVVVDYKTNRLGPEPLTTAHYTTELMATEMQHAHYVLQALLYSAALHRFLRWRQPGYDPTTHLGPVLYLFVRGMAGPDAPPGAGVFSWTPPAALVTELSDLLAGAP